MKGIIKCKTCKNLIMDPTPLTVHYYGEKSGTTIEETWGECKARPRKKITYDNWGCPTKCPKYERMEIPN